MSKIHDAKLKTVRRKIDRLIKENGFRGQVHIMSDIASEFSVILPPRKYGMYMETLEDGQEAIRMRTTDIEDKQEKHKAIEQVAHYVLSSKDQMEFFLGAMTKLGKMLHDKMEIDHKSFHDVSYNNDPTII